MPAGPPWEPTWQRPRALHRHLWLDAASVGSGVRPTTRRRRRLVCPLNSGKSNTYGINVVQRIIEAGQQPSGSTAAGKEVKKASQSPAASHAGGAAPAVQRLHIDDSSAGQRLDNYLVKMLKGAPKTLVYRIIRSGEVRVNKGRASADTRLAEGDEVRVPPLRLADPASHEATQAATPPREFQVLFEDDHLLAIDKPAGAAVHGGSGVSFGVIEQLRRARPQARLLELVHRLDKETSGLLLIAKKRSALTALQDQFRDRGTDKTYAALVIGAWPPAHKVIDLPLHKYLDAAGERRVQVVNAGSPDGRRSITLVKVAQAFGHCSLLDVTIKTGRTHQIRVHLQHAGHPIIGDGKYGDFALNKRWARGEVLAGARFDRMFLHARRLAFDHPATGERIALEAPLPAACATLLALLNKTA